jgi:hypothetical protein
MRTTTWKAKIAVFTIRHSKNSRPYRWCYDAGAEHACYLERHGLDRPAPVLPAAA